MTVKIIVGDARERLRRANQSRLPPHDPYGTSSHRIDGGHEAMTGAFAGLRYQYPKVRIVATADRRRA